MKIFIGTVVSKKMSKTATVAVDRVVVHPMYKKRYKRTKKYHVHDELGTKVGQQVKFVAGKPFSKLKKWRILKIVDEVSKESKSSKKKHISGSEKRSSKKERKTKSQKN